MFQPVPQHKSAGRIMAMVMAGGQGSRLQPLTEKRTRPAVPFGSTGTNTRRTPRGHEPGAAMVHIVCEKV